jgi:hypothetical protein
LFRSLDRGDEKALDFGIGSHETLEFKCRSPIMTCRRLLHAVRALAFKCIRVAFRCWKNGVGYDETCTWQRSPDEPLCSVALRSLFLQRKRCEVFVEIQRKIRAAEINRLLTARLRCLPVTQEAAGSGPVAPAFNSV